MRIGIFGGSFNPPHKGHIIIADSARAVFNLDFVYWLITPRSPFKPNHRYESWIHRVAMVHLILEDKQDHRISYHDIYAEPPYYSYQAINAIKNEYPDDELWFIMGGDSLADFHLWESPQMFIDLCSGIIIYPREGNDAVSSLDNPIISRNKDKIHILSNEEHPISSSQIRKALSGKWKSINNLDGKVLNYIKHHRLFQTKRD